MINDVVKDDVEMVAGIKPLAQLDLNQLNLTLRSEIPLVKITLSDEEKKKISLSIRALLSGEEEAPVEE